MTTGYIFDRTNDRIFSTCLNGKLVSRMKYLNEITSVDEKTSSSG